MSAGLPVLRRIRFTPWQDLLRLRLSGRLDWRTRLEHSELSETVRSMICDVIVKSRLTPAERASVAGELIAHFQDGQDAGQTGLQLVASFGDVQVLSQLIQRGKERNRSMFGKMIKVLGGASAVTVAAGIVWLILFANRQANPATDYVPHMNTRALAAAPAEKAWPIYRESWTRHRFVEWYPHRELPAEHPGLEYVRAGDPEWPMVLAMLDERGDLIDALRAGGRLPALGLELKACMGEYSEEDQRALFPDWFENTTPQRRQEFASWTDEEYASSGGAVIGVLLPHIQALRTAARLLAIDSRRALEQGNSGRAIENVEMTFGLAHQAAEPSCLVAALVGFAVADLAFVQVEDLLSTDNPGLSGDDLARLQQIVSRQNFRSYIQLDGERAMMPDLLQACYTDDGNGDGKITRTGLSVMTGLFPAMVGHDPPESKLEVLWTLLFSSRKEIQTAFDTWYDRVGPLFDTAWYEDARTADELIAGIADEGTAERYLMDALIPAIDGIRSALQNRLAQQDAAVTAIALQRARRAGGAWPKTLDQLVPEYLQQVPLDRMTGKQILYRLNPDPVLYTPGPDGDDDQGAPLTDAGGTPKQFSGNLNTEGWQGDRVLWPSADLPR